MLKRLLHASIDNPGIVLVLAGLAIVAAGVLVPTMPVDVFPELNAPTVVIMAESEGRSAEEVEQHVTFPIESAVNGLPGVRRVRSSSVMGLGMIWVEFAWGFDVYRARQLVGERLAIARENLPPGIHADLAPIASITGEIMLVALSSPGGERSDIELRSLAEFDMRNALLAVPGVAQVVVIGGELPEYQVNVMQERLRLYGLTLHDITRAAGEAHTTAGAGYLVDVGGEELPLIQSGRVRSVDDIRGTVVGYADGAAVTLGDVAEVVRAGAPRRGAATASGHAAVIISVQKAPGVNTLDLTAQIEHTIDRLAASLPAGVEVDRRVFRQADFIGRSIDNVLHVLRDAAIFVALILILFLMNVRATVITLLAVPLSLALALLVLRQFGLGINVMTLGGLAVAIGELVDDAIIYVENIYRRLRQNEARPESERLDRIDVIRHGGEEIRQSVVFATLIIVLVFVPLLFLEGLEGRFFFPLGIAYITSILASLVVAMTVTVALCRLLLRGRAGEASKEGVVSRWVKAAYAPALEFALRRRRVVIGAAALVVVLALVVATTFGASFLPEFNEGTFTVFLWSPPGTSLQASQRLALHVQRELMKIEGVARVAGRTGRGERDEHAEPVSNSELEVTVEPGVSKLAVRREIDRVLGRIPGITTSIGQPIEHRLSHILSGTPAAVAINIFGEDLAQLRAVAGEIETALKALPGARDVAANREVRVPSLPIDYRPAELARWGLTPAGAAEQVSTAFLGRTVAQVNEGSRRIDIVVRLDPAERQTPRDVERFELRGAGGARVRLGEVADIGPDNAPFMILREGARRKAVVSCNVAEGANLAHLVDAVRERVDPIVQAAGCTVTYGGQFEAQQNASRTIYSMGAVVALLILLLLRVALGSTRAALLVMVNLPLAILGGLVAIFLTESPSVIGNLLGLFGAGAYRPPIVSIASLVGFVTLFGIAVRNGILLVNHYAHLREHEGASVRDAVRRGSVERLIPIAMTAITAILGLLPLALAAGEPGSELLAPLAIVVLGGLVTSTLLNLVVVPAGYLMIFDRKRSAEDAESN